ISEQRVKVNQKARILDIKRRNQKEHYSENLYAVSIKEDTAYLCPKLHSASTKTRSIRRIQMKPYAVFKYKSWNILEYNNPCLNMDLNGPQVAPLEALGKSLLLVDYMERNILSQSGTKLWEKSTCPTILLPLNHHVETSRPRKKERGGNFGQAELDVGQDGLGGLGVSQMPNACGAGVGVGVVICESNARGQPGHAGFGVGSQSSSLVDGQREEYKQKE
ncbi:hypothetical protein Tco_1115670, partial [Tanacetum coccineum]